MKQLLYFLFIACTSYGQAINYQPVLIDQCTKKVVDSHLTIVGDSIITDDLESGQTVLLPDTGWYAMYNYLDFDK